MEADAIVVAAAAAEFEEEARALWERLRLAGIASSLLGGQGSLARRLARAREAGALQIWMVGRPEVEPGWIWIASRCGAQQRLPPERAIARLAGARSAAGRMDAGPFRKRWHAPRRLRPPVRPDEEPPAEGRAGVRIAEAAPTLSDRRGGSGGSFRGRRRGALRAHGRA